MADIGADTAECDRVVGLWYMRKPCASGVTNTNYTRNLNKESRCVGRAENQVPLLLYSIPLLPELWAILSELLNFPDASKQSGRLEVHSGK